MLRESQCRLEPSEKVLGLVQDPTLDLIEESTTRPERDDTLCLPALARERTKFCLCEKRVLCGICLCWVRDADEMVFFHPS
jgi:hypothetical protein